MAEGKLTVNTLGHSGVILDQNPLEPSLPDDSLRNAQNATHDPEAEHGGALRKRPGLKRFNIQFAGGIILGGTPMAVAGTGGAPATGGGGFTGDPIGSGDGTGSPGGTFATQTGTSGGGAPVYPPAGATKFNGGSTIFSGARLVVIGREDNTVINTRGEGWYVTTKQLANNANLTTTPGPPCRSGFTTPDLFKGTPSAINTVDGYLYYIKAHDETVYVAQQIRKVNGGSDTAVATIPTNTNVVSGQLSVPSMTYADNGMIYLVIIDKHSGGNAGRLMKLNPSTGSLTELNVGNPAASPGFYQDLPCCLARFNNQVYWGTFPNVSDTNASINVMSTDEKYGSLDFGGSLIANDQRYANISCMLSASGVLYAGTCQKTAGVAQRAVILVRQPGQGIGAPGAWLTVDHTEGDTVVNQNVFTSMVEYNGFIYAAWYDPTQVSRIYKCTPNPNVSGFQGLDPITPSFTSSGATGRVPYSLFVDQGILYAVGAIGLGSAFRLLYTVDGDNWVDETANFANTNNSFPIPIFFAVDQ